MSLAPVEKVAHAPGPAGGVHFIEATRHADLCAELRSRRYLVAEVPYLERGRLRHAIDDAIEGALALRGALPPSVHLDAEVDATIRDQIFRARALGATGLALDVPGLQGMLHPDDSATLMAWLDEAKRTPLLMVLDEAAREARVLAPVALAEVAPPAREPESELPPSSGEVEEAAGEPPPPASTQPRRGVMKKRPKPVEEQPAASVLKKAAALMPAVPPLDALPANEESPPADEVPLPVSRVVDAAVWRDHALELDKARGPKPVSAIERLYSVHYVPLLGAVARGEADGAVRAVFDAWRAAFEHSYREAFSALRVTGKRPPMVFDVPDIAGRLARLNGARAVKLLLVDGMRIDVGERVAVRLKEQLTGRAVCIEQMLLWSALPTTTPTQLALLGRGPDALRDAEPSSEPEPEIVRGRAVCTLRRERVGQREVMKLDVVEARLRAAGPGYDERLDAIADEVAPILLKFIGTLPARTLVFLFGDHGFRLPASLDGRTTGPATQGGVSPEEVLVPGQAWLVGGVH